MNKSDYEEYRRPVLESLEKYIRDIRENLGLLHPILSRVFEQAKLMVSSTREDLGQLKPSMTLKLLTDTAITVLRGILRQTPKYDAAKHRISVEKSIFVVGAGISFESDVPMSNDLNDLLKFTRAKNYNELRSDPQKCYKFKNAFKRMIDERQPGRSHQLLAKNFPQKISEIISLNWDNMIEMAFSIANKDSKKVNKDRPAIGIHHLWKFHGDVEEFDNDNIPGDLGWVFPDEDGYVFKSFENYISNTGLNNELFALIIVGYSESDSQIETIIKNLETNPPRPTYRVGMSLSEIHNEYYLIGPAPYVMEQVLT